MPVDRKFDTGAIDSHVEDTNNPHSVTAAQVGAVALTGDQTKDGVLTFNDLPESSQVPTEAAQLINKAYADAFAQGVQYKAAVRFVTTANVDLAGGGLANGTTHDTVLAATGNRALVIAQSDPTENGIYIVPASGAASRATDFDENSEVVAGSAALVLEGSADNASKLFAQIAIDPEIGTDALTFSKIGSVDPITASNGVQKVGSDVRIDLSDTDPALEVTDGGLRAKVDDATIERTPNGLAVKEVPWASVNKTGSKLEDAADASDLADAENGQVVAWNASENKWQPVDQSGGGGGGTPDFFYTPLTIHAAGGTSFTWSNLPVSIAAGASQLRKPINLSGAVQFRVVVNQQVAGFAGSKIRARYSVNNSTFLDMDADGSADLDVGTGTGVKRGAWADLVPGAKQDVYIQLYGYGGDGIIDPQFRQIEVQFKVNSSVVDQEVGSMIFPEVTVHSHPGSNFALTSMPLALTEIGNAQWNRQTYDLTNVTHFRITANQSTAGFAGADLNLQYSLNGSVWQAADESAAGELDVGTGTGQKKGAWAELVPGARADVWLRLVGKDGNGTVSPAFRQLKIQFKGNIAGVGGAEELNDLSDVEITSPENGQGIVYSDTDTYQATLSPLSWNGNDYDDEIFGAPAQSIWFLTSPAGFTAVTEDGTVLDFQAEADIHIGLCDIGGNKFTFGIVDGFLTSFSQTEDAAGLEGFLQGVIDPSVTVENFKADAYTFSAGEFTFNGFTGFDQAGTVAVVSGLTTPPAIAFVEGAQEYVNQFVPLSQIFDAQKDDEEGYDAVDTATPTVLTVAEFKNVEAERIISNDGDAIQVSTGPAVDGIAMITVTDDAGDLIASGTIEWQEWDNDSETWITRHSATGTTSLVFAFKAEGGGGGDIEGGNKEFRVQFTHTEGSTVDVFSAIRVNHAERS